MKKKVQRKNEQAPKPHPQEEAEASSEALTSRNCLVCCCAFNEREKRPRTLPCGHCFCSECITRSSQSGILSCPSCRKTYEIPSTNTFPVNLVLEELVTETLALVPADTSQESNENVKSLKPISKRLQLLVTEALAKVESLSCESSILRPQLQLYASQLDEWENDHQQLISQLKDLVQKISNEKRRIGGALEKEAKTKAEMEQIATSLKDLSTTAKIPEVLENVYLCSELLEEWIETTNESFPDKELVIHSQEIRDCHGHTFVNSSGEEEQGHGESSERASSHLEDVTPVGPDDEQQQGGASSNDKCPTSSMTIQEKMKAASFSISRRCSTMSVQTQCISKTKGIQAVPLCESKETQSQFQHETKATQEDCDDLYDLYLKEEDAVVKMWLLRRLLQRRRVIALHDEKESGKKYYARLSVDETQRTMLHVLSEDLVHPEDKAAVIKYEEVICYVPSTSRRAFLELGAEGKSLGKVVITLVDEGNLSENFLLLCTGQKEGNTYRNSNILRVSFKGTMGERISLGDYERTDGKRRRTVVPRVDWEMEYKRDVYKRSFQEAGFVWVWPYTSGAEVSRFLINTRHFVFSNPCFGRVEERPRYHQVRH